MIKVLPHVIRSTNELNIPAGNTNGFEILYFGVNLLLMFDYRLSFYIEAKGSDNPHQIELFIISRKDAPAWKNSASMDLLLLVVKNQEPKQSWLRLLIVGNRK